MANKFFSLAFILCLLSFISFGQSDEPMDSLIYAEGKIIHATTRQPISAKITYQSLPYGNKVGTLNNSNYSFPMFDKEKYSITVEAPGFSTAKYLLDPVEANAGKLVKDIELTPGAGAVGKKHEAGQVMRLDNLIFQLGKSKIDADSYSELDLVVSMMKENSAMIIQLEGHTDYEGDPKGNMKLSQDRVDAVKEYLVDKGINKNRIKTKAFGGTAPLSRDNTPEAHRLNRRVELRVLKN